MSEPLAELRSNRVVVISVVVAAVSVTAFSLVGIASLLGWLPQPDRAKSTVAAPEVVLIPGESLVPVPQAAQRPEPLMPRYSQPKPPPAPPPEAAEPQKAPAEPAPKVAEAPARKPVVRRPAPPSYQRHPTDTTPFDPEPRGRVTAIVAWPDRLWEVRVRFDDGPTRVFRYRSRPPFDVGDPVRLDDDFLVHD